MPKKVYHIPLAQCQAEIKKLKSTIRRTLKNNKKREYTKRFAKAHYLVELEKFINIYKINKDLDYSLRVLKYFESEKLYVHLHNILNLEQFGDSIKKSEMVLLTLESIYESNYVLYVLFLDKVFVHYHSSESHYTQSN